MEEMTENLKAQFQVLAPEVDLSLIDPDKVVIDRMIVFPYSTGAAQVPSSLDVEETGPTNSGEIPQTEPKTVAQPNSPEKAPSAKEASLP